MENAELKMTEKESIELIASMIRKAKNQVSESGTLYLLWGWLIFICCLVQFAGLYFFNYPYAYYVWFSTWILLIYQIFYIARKRKSAKVKTYLDEINAFVWIVFFICMMLLFIVAIRLKQFDIIDPMLLVLYGMPIFLSGIILKFRPLILGAACCWVLSICATFIPADFRLLLIAVAVIFAWIIPGYLLKQNFKKENGF
jgi:hypothetical protein